MAKQLDLQEQEQVDAIKAFWNQYGNLITWTLTIVLGLFAAWNGWGLYQRTQALKASTLYGQLEAAVRAGDVERATHVFGDMKARDPAFLSSVISPSVFTQQGGLLLAKAQNEKGQVDNALASLRWVAEHGSAENAAVAHLRAAGLLADQKKFDEALKEVDLVTLPALAALANDRRGDILLAKGDREGAKKAWRAAWDAMPATLQYRYVVDAKLTMLGAAPPVPAASEAASAAASGASQ
jgi:predicted negative regulator of RcsB-dependent stress response